MASWVALLRGINVGGKNRLPMAELRAELEGAGLEHVRTYVQSGNVVFRSATRSASRLQTLIAERIEASHGLRIPVLVLSAKQLEDAARANPFGGVEVEKTLHFNFLWEKPKRPNLERIEELSVSSEAWQLVGRVFYLHAPEGIGRSKLAALAERLLGVNATGRNSRTVNKLLELLET